MKYEVLKAPEHTNEVIFPTSDGWVSEPISVHRIRALKDFVLNDGTEIKYGDLGGFVHSEDALSQDGNCWIADDAIVASEMGSPLVESLEDSTPVTLVRDHAIVRDNANVIDVFVSERAYVSGNIRICGNMFSHVMGFSNLSGDDDIDVSSLHIEGTFCYYGGELDLNDSNIDNMRDDIEF